MKSFWNQRYSQDEFAYGKEPNAFFKNELDKLQPGKLFLAAEGEGRNAVYAAQKGWEVVCYDFSEEAQKKALKLADEKGVTIDYRLASLADINFDKAEFDAVGIVFVQLPEVIRRKNFQKISSFLKSGGTMILEAFSKSHIEDQRENPTVGGPKNIDQLYQLDSIKKDFENFEIEIATEVQTNLEEGIYHRGKSSVVRFVGRKI
ncbi:MAG: class I SAM-dependent methyltransferase [Flavobacteriaceae bacterium]|jgi:cyclopropane fatty-acyl-phospholipid synthase-like methyltransferase|nr:class I SAM-dependent methyltransferase [Flavobacteriaceae bacterium]NVJ72848.1 class I SAM-dependent methyltransferase [Flavobacteriaceae bacterium]